MSVRSRWVVPLAAAALALFGASCDGDGDGDGDRPAVPTSTTAAPTGDADSGDGPTTTTFDGTRVEIEVRGGEAVGGVERVEVDTGERVLLVVTSDVDDEVHVHGIDLTRDVAAGATVEVEFAADIPGVFEIEMEQSGIPIVELVVGA